MKSFPDRPAFVSLRVKNFNWGTMAAIVLVILGGCTGAGEATKPEPADFPVNEQYAAILIGKGIPADIAIFFAAAKMEFSSPNDTTCRYLQTFPNGASREITLTVSPNRQYTPTPAESATVTQNSMPMYDFHYSSTIQADGTTQIGMNYFIPPATLSASLAKLRQTVNAAGEGGGAGIAWTEIGKSGADVSIGSLIDFAKDKGIKVGPLGSIYALASALSNVASALELSKQTGGWLTELDALEQCAASPTNLVAKSDPGYSAAAVAKVQSARSELKEVNAVRFLNQMTETFSGITPVTAVLSVGLKQGFVWSEQTLNDYSENTIMREARLAVVPCDGAGTLDGNVDVLWECTTTSPTQVDHEIRHTVAAVSWVYDPTRRMYVSQGSYTFDYTKTSTAGGITCTDKKSSAGSIAGTGSLMIFDAAAQSLFGYTYQAGGQVEAEVAASYDCPGTSFLEPFTIEWLPPITGNPGTGGVYKGQMTNPSCVGNASTGTEIVKWEFMVPAAN